MKKFRIILLACAATMALCGCKANLKLLEEKTEEVTNEAVKGNTDRMLDFQMKSLESQSYTMLHGVEGFDDLILYVPPMEAEQKSDTRLSIESNGITITFKMNPSERQGATTYPIYQSVKELVYNKYYSEGCVGLSMGYAEDLSVDTARMVVSCFEECYSNMGYHDATHYIMDLNESKTLEIEVDICYDLVTENTEIIIAELEDYYDIDIEFDAEAAAVKQQAFDDNPGSVPKTFCEGDILFELPQEWDWVCRYDEGNLVAYSPFDPDNTGWCGVMMVRSDDVDVYTKTVATKYPESVIKPVEEILDCELVEDGVAEAGNTFIGDTVKLTFSYDTVEGPGCLVIYYGIDEDIFTCIYGYGVGQYIDVADKIAQIVMNTGRKR